MFSGKLANFLPYNDANYCMYYTNLFEFLTLNWMKIFIV